MLPKSVYELKPYFYLVSGSWILLFYSGVLLVLGLLLYFLGAWIWVLRSDYRRLNHRQPQTPINRHYWSDPLYELLPFGYIFAALCLIGLRQDVLMLLSATLLLASGLLVLRIRVVKRRQQRESGTGTTIGWANELALDAVPDSTGRMIPLTDVGQMPAIEVQKPDCAACRIEDICLGVGLDIRCVQELMRLNQNLNPRESFEPFQRVVARHHGDTLSREQLLPILERLHTNSDLCLTWKKPAG
ncbi:hypothetical protein DV711_09170 [Motiliproteus coralliicola]|uniref:Uncharacterized protein n=1 Tax=Motiliproteus coralliicola TaxID=2283196 RepID=A0A369WKY9_9GAMM|nr:hypothetical protein [Motiliproteus coralliicola]RDE22738.1 hypothetical protein DV711_09170 [Motiliproteus coralliicola]